MKRVHWLLVGAALPVASILADAGEPTSNQKLASNLARKYQESGQLKDYTVDILTENGEVTLVGAVANEAQRQALLQMTKTMPNVKKVHDQLTVADIQAVKYQPEVDAPKPMPGGVPVAPDKVALPPVNSSGPATGQMLQGAPIHEPIMNGAPVYGEPIGSMGASGSIQGGMIGEPMPATSFAGGVAPYSDAPQLPPYSWPAYSPYNNFASMAYQTQYPSGSWPFIGPPYPYPMIPSGWRRVSLSWRQGYWWMKFHSH